MHNNGFSYDGGRILTCDAFSETGLVKHGFSTKKDGTSSGIFTSLNLGIYTKDDLEAVRHNFSLFCRDAAIDTQHLMLLHQVHSTKLVTAEEQDAGKGLARESDLPEADGLITDRPGVALTAFSADCTPILLLDPVRKVIAAVHSGWRGTVGKIVQRAVLTMRRQYGSKSEDILAAMGPSIKQCHFEVDEAVYLEFLQHFGSAAERYSLKKGKKYYIDTDSLNIYSLLQTGVPETNISVCPLCTHCESELFFSHRRSGETGRMCAVIELA